MKKLIAVVDDDQPIVDILTIILKDEGYDVVSYTTGEELLQNIDKERINLILLDYRLPRLNGAEIAKRIKTKDKTRDIPVILISANHNLEPSLVHAPIDDFIPKPFEVSHLMKKVSNYLYAPD